MNLIVWIMGLGVWGFICGIMLWVNSLRKPLIGWTSEKVEDTK